MEDRSGKMWKIRVESVVLRDKNIFLIILIVLPIREYVVLHEE